MKMVRGLIKILAIFLLLVSCFGTVKAHAVLDSEKDWLPEKPEWAPDFFVDTSFLTKYIWRGWNLGDEPVIQNDYKVSKMGLSFDIWTNYSTNTDKEKDSGRYQEYTEIDYTVDYSFNVGEMKEKIGAPEMAVIDPIGVSIGYIYYTFPNVDWGSKEFDTHELYAGISYDCLLKPSFKWYLDVDEGRGSYLLTSFGHTFNFDGGITADLGIGFGYNYEQWTPKKGWSDMPVYGSVSIPVLNHFVISPTVAYSVILDRDTFEDTQGNEFYGGVKITFKY